MFVQKGYEETSIDEIIAEARIAQGTFNCDHIEERVRIILIMSHHLFDSGNFTVGDIEVFIDVVEKTLGAQSGTLGFIRELIN